MDLNYLLEWFVGVTTIAGLIRLLRFHSRGRSGWAVTFAVTLAILLLGLLFFPSSAGFVSGSFWIVFVLGPSVLYRYVQRNIYRQRFNTAYRFAIAAKWLHPADGLREYPELLRSFELAHDGRYDEAEALLGRYAGGTAWTAQAAALTLHRMRGEWETIAEKCAAVQETALSRSGEMLAIYLRSLGELGRMNEMVQLFGRQRKSFFHLTRSLRDLTRLYVYSFAGRPKMVERLFSESLSLYPTDIRDFWQATAQMASGDIDEGRRKLENLRHCSDGLTRRLVEQRLSHAEPATAEMLIPPSREILDQDEQSYQQESRFEFTLHARNAFVTYGLIAVCVLVFVVEMVLGGATNPRTLWQMGALSPSLAWHGQWWRIIAAQFLHYGFLHLAMNMLALYVLGPFTERELGAARYLVLYLLSGTCAMLTIIVLTAVGWLGEDYVVGASGSILGLIGATAAILLFRMRQGIAQARARLISVLLIIGVQAVFDLATPQVSFTAHLSGAIFGFLIALLIQNYTKAPAQRIHNEPKSD